MDDLSLLDAHTAHEEAIRKANETWDAFCTQMSERIPDSLDKYAREKGWIKQPGWWQLPEWLHGVVENTIRGGLMRERIRYNELSTYGFASVDDVRVKMTELAEAWKGIVKIEVKDDTEDWRVNIYFWAIEVLPKPNNE